MNDSTLNYSSNDPVERLIQAIQNKGLRARPHGKEYRAQCPAHDDQTESLTVGHGSKGAVVHCHAGCNAKDITEALAMKLGDLFYVEPGEKRKLDGRPEIIERYRYLDGDKKLRYEVCRMTGKMFRQRRPDPTDPTRWIWNLQGVDRILYRLPEVEHALAEGLPIFLVEGEKDADRLYREGLRATCNPGGAGKWLDTYNQTLRDADVVILPDNDGPGQAHADQIAAALTNVARSVRIVNLPNLPLKGDVSDWFNAGGTRDVLMQIVKDTPPTFAAPRAQIVSAAALMHQEFVSPVFAVDGWIPEGFTILAGSPKVGKSWLSLQIGVGVAAGGRVMGDVTVNQGDVLYLALEDTNRRLQARLRMLLGFEPAPEALYLATEWPRLDKGGLKMLDEWASKSACPRMIVIDTLAKIRPEQADVGYADDYRVGSMLKGLADRYGICVVAVHHRRKADDSDPQNTVSGTTGLTGAADATIVLRRARNEDVGTLWITGRDVEEREEAIKFDGDSGSWTTLGDADEYRTNQAYQQVIDLLANAAEPMGPKEVAGALGMKEGTAKWLLPELASKGVIEKVARGRYGPKVPTSPEGKGFAGPMPGQLQIPDNLGDLFGPDEAGEV